MAAKRRRARRAVPAAARSYHGDRSVVPVDAAPLRRDAAAGAVAAMRETERLRRELEAFERVAVPDFERWKARHFGVLLTELRELDMKAGRLGGIMNSLEARAFFEGIPLEEAYLREKAEEEAWSRGSLPEDPPAEEDDMTDEEIARDAADAFVRDVFGMDPGDVPPEVFEEIRQGFRRPPAGGSAGGEEEWIPPAAEGSRPAWADPLAARLKELHRQLARRLHPDARGAGASAELWHEFQEAYGRGDVERLEILVAVTDLREGVDAGRSSLFHLREAARELRRGVRGLRKRLTEARRSPAWRLWKGQASASFANEFGKMLQREKFRRQAEATALERALERIKIAAERLARRKAPARAKHRARRRRAVDHDGQQFFHFPAGP